MNFICYLPLKSNFHNVFQFFHMLNSVRSSTISKIHTEVMNDTFQDTLVPTLLHARPLSGARNQCVKVLVECECMCTSLLIDIDSSCASAVHMWWP